MLFTFATLASSAVVLGWPCQRLNWAWRNVWVTCQINAYTPASSSTPANPNGFQTTSTNPVGTTSPNVGTLQLDPNGNFLPSGATSAPFGGTIGGLCATSPNTGGGIVRNRCRRMLDVYGNLFFLCGSPRSASWTPNTLTPDWAPQANNAPHAANIKQLTFAAQNCMSPGPLFPTPTNTCPGLMGWFTVVWNACGITNVAGVPSSNALVPQNFGFANPGFNTPAVPAVLTAETNAATFKLNNPEYLCGKVPQASGSFTLSATLWNPKGVSFRTTRCRRALDQFGRAANRCVGSTAPVTGYTDPLRYLASNLGQQSPFCSTD